MGAISKKEILENGVKYNYQLSKKVARDDNGHDGEVARYRYDAFGNAVEKSGGFDSPYRFSTKEYDPATGMSYFGFRYYSPGEGRWLSKDPVGYIDGLNLYIYVFNKPINWIDSVGLHIVRNAFGDWIPHDHEIGNDFDPGNTSPSRIGLDIIPHPWINAIFKGTPKACMQLGIILVPELMGSSFPVLVPVLDYYSLLEIYYKMWEPFIKDALDNQQ